MAQLKIYFSGQIGASSAIRKDTNLYGKLIHKLQQYGEVLTKHIGDPVALKKDLQEAKLRGPKYIHDRDVAWLEQADVVIAEVTQISMGVGYEIGRAEAMNTPIMCLFRPKDGEISSMISGAENGSRFTVVHYDKEDLDQLDTVFKGFLTNIPESSGTCSSQKTL